jgi:hypothetical protein
VQRQRSAGLALASGIAFAVLFIVGEALARTPDPRGSDAQIVAFWADAGHRTQALVGAYVLCVAGALFLCFASALTGTVQHEIRPTTLTSLPAVSGAVFASMLFASALVNAAIPAAISFERTPIPSADLSRVLAPTLSGGLLGLGGGLAALVFLATTARAAAHAGILPRWLTVAGYAVAVSLTIATVALPIIFLFALWVFAASTNLILKTG